MTTKDWTAVPAGTAAVRYANLIIDRAREGLLDDSYHVDWDNAPLTVADYRTAQLRLVDPPRTDDDATRAAKDSVSRVISDVCFSAYGINAARLNINLNDRPEVHARVSSIKWARGAASGGGRYCADFYLVHAGDETLDAGVYHYSVISNGWERLQRHDRTEQLRSIQQYSFRARSYLVVTINYWRSGFKYNDFAYQATSMDVGTFFAAEAEMLGDAVAGTWDMEVDETRIAELLGLDPFDEGVYAVQPWDRADAVPVAGGDVHPAPETLPSYRRDRDPVRFVTTLALQRDMAHERPDWSTRDALRPVDSGAAPSAARRSGAQRLQNRETSFGRFSGASIDAEALTTLLAQSRAAAATVRLGATVQPDLAHLVYVNNVDGLREGLYIDDGRGLREIAPGDHSPFLESTYFLHNYMGRRAACTVILCAAVVDAAHARGVRGYRLTNAMVGAACQSMLTRANGLGIGTGTALGFDAAAHAEHAGLDVTVMAPMLMIMLGVDTPATGRVHAFTTKGAAS